MKIPNKLKTAANVFDIFLKENGVKFGIESSTGGISYICPSLFECAQNTFFHNLVIFKL